MRYRVYDVADNTRTLECDDISFEAVRDDIVLSQCDLERLQALEVNQTTTIDDYEYTRID